MILCLDYQPAVAQRAGIGRYTRLLARHLAPLFGEGDTLRLFYLDFSHKGEPPDAPGAEARPWRLLPGAVLQQLWKRGLPPAFDRLAGKADLYHFTNFVIPPLSRRAKAVVSIFDMSFERLPQCAEARNLAYLRARIGKTIERADAIITISQFSADETVELHPAAKGKTHAIPLGLDPTLAAPPPETVAEVRRRLGVERPYILSVGTLEPRKNYAFLVDAFERLGRDDVDLVIAGMPGWQCEPILDRFANSPRRSQIHYLRFVRDGDLAALYAGAELFALASLYEGFGFPPLEAMQCGAPVVSSAGGSLPEVLGDAAVIVPDFDADCWAAELGAMLDAPSRRRDYAARGIACARRYRWEETAARTLDVYRNVLRGDPP